MHAFFFLVTLKSSILAAFFFLALGMLYVCYNVFDYPNDKIREQIFSYFFFAKIKKYVTFVVTFVIWKATVSVPIVAQMLHKEGLLLWENLQATNTKLASIQIVYCYSNPKNWYCWIWMKPFHFGGRSTAFHLLYTL